jgi:hypothetical protein
VERVREQLLVGPETIEVRRIDQVDPQLDGSAHNRDRSSAIGRRLPGREAHRAEAKATDCQIATDRERRTHISRHYNLNRC